MDAVNVTVVPEQMVPEDGLLLILIVGLADELTVIVIVLLAAIAGVTHISEEVI